jgi:TonB dependent receptor/Carboxypeptidase regulatory-like domain/TonB-dependent Receptor Plug Domain
MEERRYRMALCVRRCATTLAAVVAITLAVPAGLAARSQAGGRVQGQVLDTNGEPLPGVLVEVEADATQLAARTDSDGRYAIAALPAASYEVRFSLTSFVTGLRRGVAVSPGVAVTENATLFVAATTAVVVSGRRTFTDLSTVSIQDELVGVADAASTGVVTPAELNERARRRPAEALESVPGMVVSQHSGEGKANQYYLRGFNIDHGTDLSLSVAGMPVNLPTHGHGQGYADMNFLIPELVSGIQYRKGTYAAESGDFSAAGTIRVSYLNVLDAPVARVEGGTYGYGRLFAAASPKLGNGTLLVAGEVTGNDGPWERPDEMRRWNGVARYSQGTATSGLSVTALAYDAEWNSSDQIPRRAVDDGTLSRFGYLDRTNGGETHRVGGMAEWQRTTTSGVTRVEGYAFNYGLTLFSNFTYFLDDGENGDQFEQRDDRFVFGGRASRSWTATVFGRRSLVTFGGEARRDAIDAVGLYRTASRQRLSTVREDGVGQTSGAAYAELRTQWSSVFRSTIGLRGDAYRWNVEAGDPVNGGIRTDGIVNPKVSLAFGPWRRTEIYADAGGGFHSNDGRGSTIRRDPVGGDPVEQVDPLVRARGVEGGLRTMALPRLHTTLSVWGLWIDSELLFIGDAGTTEASRPSRRVGIEWDADYRAAPWLSLDGSIAYSQARFTDAAPEGDRVPGAIEGVVSAGITIAPVDRWSGSLRMRYFGPRPLSEDNTVRSRSSTVFSAEAGYQLNRIFRIKADVLNLFDSKSADIEYFYTSRLPGEPEGGIDGFHFHPVEPFTLRFAVVATF